MCMVLHLCMTLSAVITRLHPFPLMLRFAWHSKALAMLVYTYAPIFWNDPYNSQLSILCYIHCMTALAPLLSPFYLSLLFTIVFVVFLSICNVPLQSSAAFIKLSDLMILLILISWNKIKAQNICTKILKRTHKKRQVSKDKMTMMWYRKEKRMWEMEKLEKA